MTCDKCPIYHYCGIETAKVFNTKSFCNNMWKRIRRYFREQGWIKRTEIMEEIKK